MPTGGSQPLCRQPPMNCRGLRNVARWGGAHQVARIVVIAAVAHAPGKLCARDAGGQQPRAGGQAQVVVAIHIRAPPQRDARQHVRCAAALARPHRLHMQMACSRGLHLSGVYQRKGTAARALCEGPCMLARWQHRLKRKIVNTLSHVLHRRETASYQLQHPRHSSSGTAVPNDALASPTQVTCSYKGMPLLVTCVRNHPKVQEAHLQGARCGCRRPNRYGVHKHERLRCRPAQVLSNPVPQLRTGAPPSLAAGQCMGLAHDHANTS